MELPEVGKQCEEPTCKQLDFLPYICKCNKLFCADHYLTHTETCPIATEHFKQVNLDKKSTLWRCSHPECKNSSLVPLICSKCNQHFCVAHRHVMQCYDQDPKVREAAIAKMRAPIAKFIEAKAALDKQLDANIEAATKKSTDKKKEMAIKLQLMRIKNKATGQKGIPSADRVYFNINKPAKYAADSQAVFVSKSWSLGRAIDAIAEECQVANRNNETSAEKLRLFDCDVQLADLSRIINDLLVEKCLIDGQNLSLEYVDE